MKFVRFQIIGSAVAFALLSSSGALGQSAPGTSATVPLPVSPLPGVIPSPSPKIVPLMTPPSLPPPVSEQGASVRIASIVFEGASVYSPTELNGVFGSLRGTVATQGQIIDAVRLLQFKYRQDGYFLTKVTGSLESTSAGVVLKVHVTEGYVSSVKLSGDVGPVSALVYGFLKHLEQIRPLRVADLERYVLLAQDVPGVSIRTILRPAKDEPGAVELVAQLKRKKFDGFMSIDNRGSRETGPYELLLGVQSNSFTSLGERTQVIIYNTPFNSEEIFGQVSSEAYVGTQGLKIKGYAGYGVLEPGDVLAAAQYKSRIALIGVGATYPLIRTRALSLYLDSNFDVSNSTIDLNAFTFTPGVQHRNTTSNLRVARLGVHATIQDSLFGPAFTAANYGEFKIHQGLPFMPGGSVNGDKFQSRPGNDNGFTKLTGELRRTQTLYTWNTNSLALFLAASGQWTGEILPSNEKFFLGGIQYGRGYYYGELTGDDAVGGTVELQFNDPRVANIYGHQIHIGLQYYGFYDIGQTWNHAKGDLNNHLESGGVGIRADVTERVSLQLEGVERFTRRPTGANVSRETEHAVFFRVGTQF